MKKENFPKNHHKQKNKFISKWWIIIYLIFFLLALYFIFSPKIYDYLIYWDLNSENKVEQILALGKESPDYTGKAIYRGKNLGSPPPDIPLLVKNLIADEKKSQVLGENDQKWIEVNLSQQKMYTWEGNNLIGNYVVSTGLPGTPTVTGDFRIYAKYASTKMSGPGYYLPGVPCTMYFYKGYGIHGTYWHNNFGHPMSHGCVNMKTPEACAVFSWANLGTRVNIHY